MCMQAAQAAGLLRQLGRHGVTRMSDCRPRCWSSGIVSAEGIKRMAGAVSRYQRRGPIHFGRSCRRSKGPQWRRLRASRCQRVSGRSAPRRHVRRSCRLVQTLGLPPGQQAGEVTLEFAPQQLLVDAGTLGGVAKAQQRTGRLAVAFHELLAQRLRRGLGCQHRRRGDQENGPDMDRKVADNHCIAP